MKKNFQVIYKYFRVEDVHEYAITLHVQEIYSSRNDVTSISKLSRAKTFPRRFSIMHSSGKNPKLSNHFT